jgi:hypothetical protein
MMFTPITSRAESLPGAKLRSACVGLREKIIAFSCEWGAVSLTLLVGEEEVSYFDVNKEAYKI